jgi:hypothetical protein
MAYTGQGYMPTIGGRMYANARFNDQSVADAFGKAVGNANPGFQGVSAGQYFTGEGGTQYKTVAGIDPNQPGWGNMVEPGYELVGYQAPEMYTGMQRQLYGNTPSTPGYAILRKQAPAPAPITAAAATSSAGSAPITPQTSYQDRIPAIEADVTEAEKATGAFDIKDAYEADNKLIEDLQKQLEGLNERLKIASQQAIADTESRLRPEFAARLGQANSQIEHMRDLMIQQSQAFEGQTAAQRLDAQRQAEAFAAQIQAQSEAQAKAQAEAQAMAERQAQIYQSNITNLQSRLDQETAAYRSELQGLAESQRAFQINQARASISPDFQISSTQNQQTGGTQQFKIRRPVQRIQGTAGLIPLISTLNI